MKQIDARVSDNDGRREIRNSDLRVLDVPSYEGWERFALSFDGYEAVGPDRCAEIANRKSPRTLTEFRVCLFFEQRRWRHFGQEPDVEARRYIESLLEGIR